MTIWDRFRCRLEHEVEAEREELKVDAPETVHPQKPVEHFGKEAAAFTRRHLKGKSVRVEYDWEKKDKYGRTLVYLFLEDGTFFNAELEAAARRRMGPVRCASRRCCRQEKAPQR